MKYIPSLLSRYLTIACLFAIVHSLSYGAEKISIVQDQKSNLSIVIPALSPESVVTAANELQQDVATSTGATLPIRRDNEEVVSPFISLGSTVQARDAGITTQGLENDGYRIQTKDGNFYILGIDTTSAPSNWKTQDAGTITLHPEIPGEAFTKNGGFSNGTANGVYSFLEDQLGVRWLFPGDLGKVVPETKHFGVEAMEKTFNPRFDFRIISGIRNSDEWRARQKLGYSTNIQYVHNWDVLPVEYYDKHPDWFPMIHGERPRPPEKGYKVETTHPEVVRYFADVAIKTLKDHPRLYNFTLSPSDGGGWSNSPETQKYLEPSEGKYDLSRTRLILKWYRDVSKIVADAYPEGKLGGYLYTSYLIPPKEGGMEFPDNFIPTIVGSSMGYSFYQDEVLKKEEELLRAWGKYAKNGWYYYGMPTWLRESSAQITPAAPERLNTIFRAMAENHIKGAEIYGTFKWSQGALKNYLQAKLLWDPTADAVALQRDWLINAYGEKAGLIMEKLYQKMDESWWADYFRSPQSRHYNISEILFRNTYGTYYPEMEKLFLEAWAQPMTELQRERLDLIRQNMIALQFRLRNAGYLGDDFESPLKRTPKEVFALMTDPKTRDIFSYVLISPNGKALTPVNVTLGAMEDSGKKERTPNPEHVLLYSRKDQTITLTPEGIRPGSSFLTYYIQDEKGKLITQGFLTDKEPITFSAKANRPYYFSFNLTGLTLPAPLEGKLHIADAVVAKGAFYNDTLSLTSDSSRDGSVYVYLPDDLCLQVKEDSAGVTIQTESQKEVKARQQRDMHRGAQVVLKKILDAYRADMVEDLSTHWRFITDAKDEGEAKGFAYADFNDTAWKKIHITAPWTLQGFDDYHGTAWYRKTFELTSTQTDPLAMGEKQLLLFLGNIDGDAKVFVNGKLIDDRKMNEHTLAWEQPLVYKVNDVLQTGKNTIVLKVTKDKLAAGPYRGGAILQGIPTKEK